MGNCRDCRWWVKYDRTDFAPVQEIGDRICDLMTSVNARLTHQTKAMAYDREEYGARVYTAPDFGCVQFAAKEP